MYIRCTAVVTKVDLMPFLIISNKASFCSFYFVGVFVPSARRAQGTMLLSICVCL